MKTNSEIRRPLARDEKWFRWILAGLAAMYLAQIVTPLRLDHDSVLYFRIAMAMAEHAARPAIGLPDGFPRLIVAFDQLGFRVRSALIVFNLLALFAGLFGAWLVLEGFDVRVKRVVVVLTLLCFPIIKASVLPEPDTIYLGLSVLAVAAMQLAANRETPSRYGLLLMAITLTGLSLGLRSAAVALVPALLWTVWMMATRGTERTAQRRIGLIFGCVIVVAAFAALAFVLANGSFGSYVDTALLRYSERGMARSVVERAGSTVNRFGELAINMPAIRFYKIQPYMRYPGFIVAGLLALYVRSVRRIDPLLVYFTSTISMLVLWPYDSSRLWIPILPFLIAFAAKVILDSSRFRPARILGSVWLAWMVCVGLAAMAFTTRISYSGSKFPQLYGVRGGLTLPGEEGRNPLHDTYVRLILARYDPAQALWRQSSGSDR